MHRQLSRALTRGAIVPKLSYIFDPANRFWVAPELGCSVHPDSDSELLDSVPETTLMHGQALRKFLYFSKLEYMYTYCCKRCRILPYGERLL